MLRDTSEKARAYVQERREVLSLNRGVLIPAPETLAETQTAGANRILGRDLSDAPQWGWADMRRQFGPMLPGNLIVPGALTGNGKSTMLLSQMDYLAESGIPTLYIPLEVEPEVCRLHWAAWKCGLNRRAVISQDWTALPEGARESLELMLEELRDKPVQFAPEKRMSWARLATWCRWAVQQIKARIVIVDHFHRLEFGDAQNYRVSATEFARQLKDLARELGVVMLAAAQLNRSSDPVDQYIPPSLARLKESAGIGEEADVVVMLSRRLKRDLPKGWMQDLRLGHLREADIAEPNRMVVTCRKHRLDNDALNQFVTLQVQNGRLVDAYRYGGAT